MNKTNQNIYLSRKAAAHNSSGKLSIIFTFLVRKLARTDYVVNLKGGTISKHAGRPRLYISLHSLSESEADDLYQSYLSYHETHSRGPRNNPPTRNRFFSYLRKFGFLSNVSDSEWRHQCRETGKSYS